MYLIRPELRSASSLNEKTLRSHGRREKTRISLPKRRTGAQTGSNSAAGFCAAVPPLGMTATGCSCISHGRCEGFAHHFSFQGCYQSEQMYHSDYGTAYGSDTLDICV